MTDDSQQKPATVADVNRIVLETEHRLVETMRNMQTELLRGFEAFAVGQTFRIRKVEADQSNLDASLSGRVEILERRLLEIELRLGGAPPTPLI